MMDSLNHVLETQKPSRAPAKHISPPATGDVAGEPFELPLVDGADGGVPASSKDFKLFGSDGFDVFDVLDMINPLQHIPVISTIYRRITGDELSPGARIVGATLLGGPLGAALALADSAVEFESGKDTGANLYAALFGDEGPIPAAGMALASLPAAAPWKDPDLAADTVTVDGGSGARAFVAAAAPDLGALSDFTTGAGGHVALSASPIPPSISQEPGPIIIASPWKNPDLEPLSPSEMTQLALMNEDTQALEASARAQAIETSTAEARISTPAPVAVERPMPSEAAKAQAISALAAMPTSQTAAAVAQLAKSDPQQPVSRAHMVPPAGDIPRGAAAALSRKATNAYATSMSAAKPTMAEVVATTEAHNANAVAALERSTTGAQNDWMLDAMQRAMAKYEASAKLRTAANGEAQPNISGNAQGAGISITR